MSFSAEDVIEHLEQCGREPYRFFIDLSHGYFFNATTFLHLYADDGRWAMIFETAGYGNRSGFIELELFYYGNCLRDLPRAGANDMFECNMESLYLVEPHELERIEDDFEAVALSVGGLTIRGVQLVVPTEAEAFREAGIEVDGGHVSVWGLVRYLAARSPDPFRATETELRMHLPPDLPHLLTVHEWHHRQYAVYEGEVLGDLPSSYETYPSLARVLSSRDPSRYSPRLLPNTHWSNWPEAGTL